MDILVKCIFISNQISTSLCTIKKKSFLEEDWINDVSIWLLADNKCFQDPHLRRWQYLKTDLSTSRPKMAIPESRPIQNYWCIEDTIQYLQSRIADQDQLDE